MTGILNFLSNVFVCEGLIVRTTEVELARKESNSKLGTQTVNKHAG